MRRSFSALVLALSLAATTVSTAASAATPAGPRPHLSQQQTCIRGTQPWANGWLRMKWCNTTFAHWTWCKAGGPTPYDC